MNLINECAKVFQHYCGYDYTFTLDCMVSFVVSFRPSQFYHLAGLQYLTDINQLNKNVSKVSSASIYKKVLKNEITQNLIEKSSFYNKISERLVHFLDLGKVISSKLIIDFDYTKVPKTDLMSKYLLYTEFEEGYVILGLVYNSKNDVYVPETFIVDHSGYYIKNQISYDVVNIEAKFHNK